MKLTTTKGQYEKGEPLTLRLDSGLPDNTEVLIKIYHLDSLIYEIPVIPSAGEINVVIPKDVIPVGARGFGCVCEVVWDGEGVTRCSTAFDYRDPEKPVIRYGFLSDFKTTDASGAEQALNFLAEFHMSHVQFYDWTYRHHAYEGPSEVFSDTMGKEIDFRLVSRKIAGCKLRGMKAVGYGAVYAAGEEYLEEHPDQSLRDADGKSFNLINKFFIMDIRRGSGWRTTLMEQYRYALNGAGFDGIHMDTYGFPKRAFADDSEGQKLVYLEDDFPDLIDETRAALGEQAVLIFNNVGNWPVAATGAAGQNAVYIEVWEPHDRYYHIRQIILSAAVFKKPVILAAYLAPFRLLENHGGCRALNAALILHSVITSFGASQLLLGEGGSALTQGYYNDYSVLRDDERDQLRKYYDFQVRYTDVLQDSDLVEISETHTAGENREYFFNGAPVSADGRAGTIWTIVRESRKHKIISLINLTTQEDSLWNAGKYDCSPVSDFSIELPDDGGISRIFTASPDKDSGNTRPVSAVKMRNERGAALRIVLENLHLWTIVVIEK